MNYTLDDDPKGRIEIRSDAQTIGMRDTASCPEWGDAVNNLITILAQSRNRKATFIGRTRPGFLGVFSIEVTVRRDFC